MKKTLFAIFFILIIAKINAESTFDVNWNFGSAGTDINFSTSDDDSIELTAALVNLTFEQKDLHIGIEFNPMKCWYIFKFQDGVKSVENAAKFSFINTGIYWDLLYNNRFLFGPVMSIHYMYIGTITGIDMNEYVFSSGLRFAYKMVWPKYLEHFKHYNPQIVTTEIGYKNIMGQHKGYFSINLDILFAILCAGNAVESNQK